jgi:hypothetical protein
MLAHVEHFTGTEPYYDNLFSFLLREWSIRFDEIARKMQHVWIKNGGNELGTKERHDMDL